MSFIASLPAGPQTWLLNSPLAPHLDAFAAHLAEGGYSAQTTRNHFLGVAHFARWMTQCALPVSLLDEQLLQQFLAVHLSHCSCPPPAVSDPSKHRSSLGHLMVVLRKSGAVAEVSPAVGPIPDELRQLQLQYRSFRLGSACSQFNTDFLSPLWKFRTQISLGSNAESLQHTPGGSAQHTSYSWLCAGHGL